ncbi:SDR family oxidoreductase [Alteromonas sp. 1_MG-2023]|uniref:SDR family oxidoreductase n=1 Tax=Alteromonas sp. 1_MG-2023 TaxID=3062669 RepID=UPI0026E4175A|nr:SDR family oxidoreductase [Alteromonas sp. 1_MG-2023]MDO6474564.1 SDR family oxidoreductase [Alteromonas sp. 1_MG-2023]
MANVFIVGAAGKVGSRLVKRLSDNDHQVTAMHRKPEQSDSLTGLGGKPCLLSITDASVDSLATAMEGADTVVFSAGAGGASVELTNAVDGEGLEKSVDAAQAAGVKRFILVSAFPDAGRGKHISETFENYMRVKRLADVYLAQSKLDWVILRPGTLTLEEGTGKVNAGLAIKYGDISRDDVAETLLAIIENEGISRKIIELTEGETPVREAIASVPA